MRNSQLPIMRFMLGATPEMGKEMPQRDNTRTAADAAGICTDEHAAWGIFRKTARRLRPEP